MPLYEYKCTECNNIFDFKASLEEMEKGLKPKCPFCGSEKTIKYFGGLNFISGSKDTDLASGSGFGSSCSCGGGCGS